MRIVLTTSIMVVIYITEIVGFQNTTTLNSRKKQTNFRNLANESRSTSYFTGFHNTTTLNSRKKRRRPFRISVNESKRLRSLHFDVAMLRATYVPRETIYSTKKDEYSQRQTRKNKPYTLARKRPTKSTTKIYYSMEGKRYPTHLERRKMIYRHFVNVLSLYEEDKKDFLTKMEKDVKKKNPCYIKVMTEYTRHCYYDYYYLSTGMKYVRNLLNNACSAKWLTSRKIIKVIEGCCKRRFIFEQFPFLYTTRATSSTGQVQLESSVLENQNCN